MAGVFSIKPVKGTFLRNEFVYQIAEDPSRPILTVILKNRLSSFVKFKNDLIFFSTKVEVDFPSFSK